MKKLLLTLMVSSLVLASCKQKEIQGGISIDPTSLTLTVGQTGKVTFITSGSNLVSDVLDNKIFINHELDDSFDKTLEIIEVEASTITEARITTVAKFKAIAPGSTKISFYSRAADGKEIQRVSSTVTVN